MSASFNGSNQWLSAATSPVSAYPISIALRHLENVNNVAQYLAQIDNSASALVNGLRARAAGDVGGPPLRFTTGDGTSNSAVNTATNFTTATWQTAFFICNSNILRSGYLNNGGLATDSTSLTPTGLNRIMLGVSALLAVNSGFLNGLLCDVGIYNRVLTTNERAMYQAGLSANNVAKDGLVAHFRLFSDILDYVGSTTLTNNGSVTFSTNPPIKVVNNGMMMGMM